VGIKLPFFIWYGGRPSSFEAKDPPWNMQLGMAIAAFLCFFIGIYPEWLYRMLPFPVAYEPYTAITSPRPCRSSPLPGSAST